MKPPELKINIKVDTTDIEKCKSLLHDCIEEAKRLGLRKRQIRKYFTYIAKKQGE
jgi:DNA-binding transcriptional regulator YhcF (GntR family)